MKTFQILFADNTGLQMLRHRVVINIEEHITPTADVSHVSKAASSLAPERAVFARVTDSQGIGLTPWLLLAGKEASSDFQVPV
jgi:hypothetical protein